MIKQTYDFTIDTSMLDRYGVVTPEGYQRMVVTTTEKELERINLSIATLIKNYGISWVLLSFTVKILQAIKPSQNLKITTWHTWQKGVIFRRDFEICDESGNPLVYATTFSSLFDIQKRRICMDRKVYEMLNLEGGDELFDAESRHQAPSEKEFCEETAVRPHWIDSLGHVNNFKYGQLAYDNLTDFYRENSKHLQKLEMFFTGELRLGESVVISRHIADNLVEIVGEHAEDNKSAFLVRMHY